MNAFLNFVYLSIKRDFNSEISRLQDTEGPCSELLMKRREEKLDIFMFSSFSSSYSPSCHLMFFVSTSNYL